MDDKKQGDSSKSVGHPLSVDVSLIAKLNLAGFQNAVPMLRELSIINDSAEEAKELELTLETVPTFIKTKTWQIDVVGVGQKCSIKNLDVQLDGTLLTRLTE